MKKRNEDKMVQRIKLAIQNDDLIENLIREMEKPEEEKMKRTESKKKSKGTS